MSNFNFFVPQGWECPKCKRVYSPTTMMCIACPNLTQTGIGSSSTPVYVGVNPIGSTTTVCGQYIGELDSGTNPDPKCIKCGVVRSQHPVSSSTI